MMLHHLFLEQFLWPQSQKEMVSFSPSPSSISCVCIIKYCVIGRFLLQIAWFFLFLVKKSWKLIIQTKNSQNSWSSFSYMLVEALLQNFHIMRYLFLFFELELCNLIRFHFTYALDFILYQLLVGAFRKIPKASWNAKERFVSVTGVSMCESDEK